MMVCHWCGAAIPTTATAYREIRSGWAKLRAKGGAHGVTLAEWGERYACRSCVLERQRGLVGQEALDL